MIVDMKKIPEKILNAMRKIESGGFEVLIVGGAVRDMILKKEPSDYDLATNASIAFLEKTFKTHDIGRNKEFGIVVADLGDNESIEIAQYRVDFGSIDGRHPNAIGLTSSFEEDSARRDLTINAMGVNLNGEIFDKFGGLNDIKNRVVTTVGLPQLRFNEDYLRMLRVIRFAAKLDFEICLSTIDAIRFNASQINTISKERVWKEIYSMASATGEDFARGILLLKKTNLLLNIFPEILRLNQFEHSEEHHPEGNVFEHTIAALCKYRGNDPLINLGILFHDVGKPETYFYEKGLHRYNGHDAKGEEVVQDICKKFKTSKLMRDTLAYFAKEHMKVHKMQEMKNSSAIKMVSHPEFKRLLQVVEADKKSRMHLYRKNEMDDLHIFIDKIKLKIKEMNFMLPYKKAFNGSNIIQKTGIEPGPELGEIKKKCIEYAIDNDVDINNEDNVKKIIFEFSKAMFNNSSQFELN